MKITVETIRRFPTLARSFNKLAEPPINVMPWLRSQTTASDDHGLRIGAARRCSAKLLLHLMGEEPTFDLRSALNAWDPEHLAAAQAIIFASYVGAAAEGPPSEDFAAGCLTVP